MAAKDAASGRGPYAVCAPSRTGCVTEGAAFRPVDPSGHSAEGLALMRRLRPIAGGASEAPEVRRLVGDAVQRRCAGRGASTYYYNEDVRVPRALSAFLSSRVQLNRGAGKLRSGVGMTQAERAARDDV